MISKLRRTLRNYRIPFLGTPPPRRWRPQWIPFWMRLRAETDIHPHVPRERGELFLSNHAAGTEAEVLNWLYSTVCLLKPSMILETGTAEGFGSIALASACKANGFGHVHTLELDADTHARAMRRIRAAGLSEYVTGHNLSSLDFLSETDIRFNLAFFDSMIEIRASEYERCLDRGLLNGLAVFHDTSPYRNESDVLPPANVHSAFRNRLKQLARERGNTGFFESTLSRGLFVIFPSED